MDTSIQVMGDIWFYRLMDIHFSFFFKAAAYCVMTTPFVAERVEKYLIVSGLV